MCRSTYATLLALLMLVMSVPVGAKDKDSTQLDKRTEASVKLIRGVFNMQASKTRRALEKHSPSGQVDVTTGVAYRPNDPDALVDVYSPVSVDGDKLPAIIWIHGGAWLSGSRQDAAPYFKLLADAGFVVLAPDYSLAPASTYPKPIQQLTDLKHWIDTNARDLRIDNTRLFLAGDSAGAQLAAQLALMGSNPSYARAVGIEGVFTPSHVRGVLLNCGVFDLPALVREKPERSRIMTWGTGTTALVYAGTKDPASPVLLQMSPKSHVTSRSPPTWISGGNADPLTADHSKPLAARLDDLGVPVTTLFWPDDYKPKLEHEYQFNLDNAAGKQALESMIQFLKKHS